MPRVRSSESELAVVADQPTSADIAAAAAGVGALTLSASGEVTEAIADSFAEGRIYRAYGHDARSFDLCFHPTTCDLLVSASDDCTAGVWRRQDGAGWASGRYMQVACFRGHADSVMRAAWSPDGHMIASGSSNGVVCLWRPSEAAFKARHNLGAAGTSHLASLEGHPEEVYACLFLQQQPSAGSSSSSDGSNGGASAAGHRLVAASGESLFLWDVATQKLLQQAASPPMPDAAGNSAHQMPERWRPGYLFGVAAQPDGPLIGAACSDGRLRLWAREGGDSSIAPLCTLPWNQAMGSDCCFGPQGLFCAVSKDGSVLMMDVRRGRCLQHLQLGMPLVSCTLLQQGGSQVLVAAGGDGAIHFVGVDTGDVASLAPEAGPLRPLLCATLSSDGTTLAATGETVLLGEHDLMDSAQPKSAPATAAAATAAAGARPGHKPPPKWSPIHVWQRCQELAG